MIYLGVEYGTKFVLENPIQIPSPTGKVNEVVDPIFTNPSLTAQWESGSVKIALREVGVEIPTGEFGYRAALEVAPATSGFLQTKTAIKVGVERVDYGFWVKAPEGTAMALESLAYKSGGALISGAATAFTGTGVWQWVAANRTMPAETAEAKFRIKTAATNGLTVFYVWGSMVTTGRSTPIDASEFFPTAALLKNKESQWTGAEAESAVAQYVAVERVVFNDSTDPDYVGDLDPESSGLDAPEIREDSNDRVESDGAIFGDFFAGKRPVILQGRIIATSKAQRNERVGKLRAASNAKTEDATLWWEDPAGGKVFVNVRRQQPLRVTKGFVKEFQLSLVAADSRILSYALETVTDEGISTASQEKSPGAAGQVGVGQAWANMSNIVSNNNVYATTTGTTVYTAYLWGAKYGFSIPTGSIALGVEVMPEHKASKNEVYYLNWIQISHDVADLVTLNAGLVGPRPGLKYVGYAGTLEPEFVQTVEAQRIVGGPNDTWQYLKYLTSEVINSATFGVALQYETPVAAGSTTVSVDWVPIKITYAEPLEVAATNEGDVPAPATIKVKGPLENFYVFNRTTEEILTYTGKVEAGNEIWFDTQNVTVTEHGTGITEPINRFANVGLPNDWIRIYPGANTILVAGVGGNSNTELTVEYRNAWE